MPSDPPKNSKRKALDSPTPETAGLLSGCHDHYVIAGAALVPAMMGGEGRSKSAAMRRVGAPRRRTHRVSPSPCYPGAKRPVRSPGVKPTASIELPRSRR